MIFAFIVYECAYLHMHVWRLKSMSGVLRLCDILPLRQELSQRIDWARLATRGTLGICLSPPSSARVTDRCPGNLNSGPRALSNDPSPQLLSCLLLWWLT